LQLKNHEIVLGADMPSIPLSLKCDDERYLALAQAEARAGNGIAAENYYQHAEHFFRAMGSDTGAS
jgi:hypothetical protein